MTELRTFFNKEIGVFRKSCEIKVALGYLNREGQL